jgi:hypothetical protein
LPLALSTSSARVLSCYFFSPARALFFCAVTGSLTNPSIAGGAAALAPTRDAHAAVVHSLPPCARRRGRPSTCWFPPLAAAAAACHAARHRQRCRFHVAAGVFRSARVRCCC